MALIQFFVSSWWYQTFAHFKVSYFNAISNIEYFQRLYKRRHLNIERYIFILTILAIQTCLFADVYQNILPDQFLKDLIDQFFIEGNSKVDLFWMKKHFPMKLMINFFEWFIKKHLWIFQRKNYDYCKQRICRMSRPVEFQSIWIKIRI